MVEEKKKRTSRPSTEFVGGKWKQVEIADEFLLGLSEPGFQELEVLEPGDFQFDAATDTGGATEGDKQQPQKRKRKQKSKKDSKRVKKEHSDVAAEPSNPQASQTPEGCRAPSAGAAYDLGCVPDTPEPAQLDMSAWDDYGLDELVLKSLSQLAFTSPTEIQHECLPAAVLGNADLITAAQTGSGKTLAFALPIVNFLVKEARAKQEAGDDGDSSKASQTALRALILCPTRELALQVAKDMTALAKALCVRVVALVGGISPQKQTRLLSYKPPIVVATPGRLWDLMQSGAQHLVDLRYLNFFVLDEADRMVAQGHYEELTHILAQIPKSLKDARNSTEQELQKVESGNEGVVQSVGGAAGDEIQTSQQVLVGALRTYVFSATLALPDQLKSRLQHGGAGSRGSRAGASLDSLMHRLTFRGKPKIADLTTDRKVADNVVEAFVTCVPDERDTTLYYLLRMHPGRTLVFLNAISGVRRLAALLKVLGINVQVLHAQQQQRQRLKALSRFQSGKNTVMVATDVAARGLHIPDVDMVVQYQLPPTADTYIHRAGRTARAGAEGVCVSVVVPDESDRFSRLHVALGQKPPQQFPVDSKVLGELRTHARLAKRIDALENVNSKANADRRWMQRQSAAIEAEMDDSGDDQAADEEDHDGRDVGRKKDTARLAKRLRIELAAMLAKPLKGAGHVHTGNATFKESKGVPKSETKQQSAPTEEHVAAARELHNSQEQTGGRAKSRKRPKTLAECQANAMQKALHAKRMKKMAKKGAVQRPSTCMRPEAVSALQVLRSAGMSAS